MEVIQACVSPDEAAKILDCSPQFVRIGLQQQRLPFGTAVKMTSNWVYHISIKLLKEYIGEERVNNFLERGD